MIVLLINPPSKAQPVARDMAGGLGFGGGNSVLLPPLDLAYYGATLLSNDHEAEIIDSDIMAYTKEDVYRLVSEKKADVIIATVSLPGIYSDCDFIRGLRTYSSARIIVKTSIAFEPVIREILERSSADLCIHGECDTTIHEIMVSEKRDGTAYVENGRLKIENNCLIDDLNSLPVPARHLLPNEKYRYVLLGDNVTTMQTSRGCPFPCSYYCAYPLVQGKKWRERSPEHVLVEIEDIVKSYNIRQIFFRDATFTFDKERTESICNLILQEKIDVTWWCETRIDRLDQELMVKMKQTGCAGMNIGIEAGDPEVLKNHAKIGSSIEKIKNIVKTGKDIDMKLHFLLIMGLPQETKKSLYKTYKLVRDLKPDSMGVTLITPYPGTPLYVEAKDKDWIETEDWSKYDSSHPVMHTDNLSSGNIVYARNMLRDGFRLSKCPGLVNKIKEIKLDFMFGRWGYKD
jgi:radical SAM superfamily enzyme YgiQ (UPF0313 family)